MRNYRTTTDGFRVCNRCDACKPLDADNFIKDATRPLGFAYECIPCHRQRKRLNPGKSTASALRSRARKDKINNWQRTYYKTAKGRSISMVAAYRKIDGAKGMAFDLDQQWIIKNILGKACTYCERLVVQIGCDRVNNLLGHTKENCVPCCATCNVVRSDIFSHAEMFTIGKTIAHVLNARLSDTCVDQSRSADNRASFANSHPS